MAARQLGQQPLADRRIRVTEIEEPDTTGAPGLCQRPLRGGAGGGNAQAAAADEQQERDRREGRSAPAAMTQPRGGIPVPGSFALGGCGGSPKRADQLGVGYIGVAAATSGGHTVWI